MDTQAQAFTVTEFCEIHRIGRGLFYLIQKRGTGPKLMKVGSRTLISREAAAEWRTLMEKSGAVQK